jgi:hypothetical protein
MKNQKINKILTAALIALVIMVATISPAIAAPRATPKNTRTASLQTFELKGGIGDIIHGILKPFLTLIGKNRNYRALEKNVFTAMPDKMPREYKTPKYKVKVHAETAPTSEELDAIDAAFARLVRNTSGDFAEQNGFLPVEAFRNWTFEGSKFRVWLIDYPASTAPSEAAETLGCTVIKTSNSSTGKAAEAFGGFKVFWNGTVEPTYPLIVAPRVKGAELARPECVTVRNNGVYFGMEHQATLKIVKVNGKKYQSFLTFTGPGDVHNIFKDR